MRARIATTLASALFALLATAGASAHPHPDAAGGGEGGRRFHHFERFLPHQGRLGVQLQDMTPELREFLRAPKERGVLVVRVNEGSAAEKAGLRVGDVIVAAGGESVDDTGALVHAVLGAEKDAKLALEVVRDGKPLTIEATLEGEPPFTADPMRGVEERAPEFRRNLERRMRELEERLRELEERLRGLAESKSDELDA
jgi:membrane-associated protease RseP (regulator of RpoE activity)